MRKKTYNINFESRKQGHTMGKEFFTGKLFSKTSAIDWIPMVKVTYVPFFHFSFFFYLRTIQNLGFNQRKKIEHQFPQRRDTGNVAVSIGS